MRKKPYTLRFHTNSYQYLGNHPKERSHKWAENAQGVTHDADHWYLSNDKKLFKYHVTSDISSNNTVSTTGMPANLSSLGYQKFKALTYFDGFLFVPIVGDNAPGAAIAMFRPSDLSYVFHILIPESLEIGNPGWVAIHPKEGRLYTSRNKLTFGKGLMVFDFAINGDGSGFSMTFSHEVFPRLGIKINHMQGGVFSPEGQLYIINGYLDTDVRKGGISVFSMHDFHFKQKSRQRGAFRFQWDTSWNVAEEPEGMTFWDLDADDRAPKISGQLHALLLDNDWPDDDDVYMKHYRMSDPIPMPIPPFFLRHAFLKDENLTNSSPDHVKGLTHNHQHEFWATSSGLSKRPILPDNPDNLTSVLRSWPDTVNNYATIGDICHVDGHILVPFSDPGRVSILAAFDAASLNLQSTAALAQSTPIACVGIDARSREHLYAIDAAGNGQKYKFELSDGQINLIPDGNAFRFDDRELPSPIQQVTGGEISAVSGFFYLAHDGQITVFHSDGTFVDAAAIEYNLGEATFDGPQTAHEIKLLTVDRWHEPFQAGTDFDNIADATALAIDQSSAILRSWEIRSIVLIGNKRSKELHLRSCPFQRRMAPANYVPFKTVEDALSAGYNGCYYCMRIHDTG